MTARELRRLCLRFPGAVEDFPFGPETSVFKVEGKMFALSALGSSLLKVSLKCEPDLADQLRSAPVARSALTILESQPVSAVPTPHAYR